VWAVVAMEVGWRDAVEVARVVAAMAARRNGEQEGKLVAQEEVAMVPRKEAQKVVAPEVPRGTEAQRAVERVEAELAKVGIGAVIVAFASVVARAVVGQAKKRLWLAASKVIRLASETGAAAVVVGRKGGQQVVMRAVPKVVALQVVTMVEEG
jgi:hypothetical protein